MLFTRLLENISRIKYIGYYIAVVGFVVALIFSFAVYPKISSLYNLTLDPDDHGPLGYGIWKLRSLAYYPDTQPTVGRGPSYPLFEAFCLMITNSWWPQSVQIGQCILFALTCFLVFWISKTLWSNRVAVLISLICAFHPFVFWYTSRIWIETLAIFLFTLLIASILYLTLKPSMTRSIILGCVLAISALCKQTFLPYVLFVPLFLGILKNKKIGCRFIVYTFITAVLVILPWTIRNWTLTKKFIPVHVRAGSNIFLGDVMVDNYTKSPFSIDALWRKAYTPINAVKQTIPEHLERWERELILDSKSLEKSIDRYRKMPTFIFKKMIFNGLMFWTLGETTQKSAVITLMQMPLLFLFILTTIKVIKQKNILTVQGGNILFVWLYFILHLPFFAIARFGVVLIPTMLTSLGVIMTKLHEKEIADEK